MIMTSTPAQNSRYPRPLKATVTFHHHSSPESSPLSCMVSEPPSRIDSLCFTPKLICSTDHSINDGCCSIDDASKMSSIVDQDRRSNSLDSLSENNLAVTNTQPEGNHTHKRSNSLTNTIQVIPQTATAGYSRFSVEDLNQEVSSALEGKSLLFEYSHPDGHIAPVNDLIKGGVTHISVTTPIHSSPSFSSTTDDLSSSVSSLRPHCSSPVIIGVHPSLMYPPSPKSSFDHRPPDWAEPCTSIHSEMFYSNNYTPIAPDRTKANIVFNGSAFSPLLPSPHTMETLTIS